MAEIIGTALNYVWTILRLFLLCAVFSLPLIGIVYILRSFFKKLNKRFSFIISLFFCVFIVSYVFLLLLYFIPILSKIHEFTFLDAIIFILYHIVRLLLVNALFSAIFLIIGMFVVMLYDNYTKPAKKTKKEEKIKFLQLWKSFTIVLLVVFVFVFLVFPKLPLLILYLIYV